MPRPRRLRRIFGYPSVTYFRPVYGTQPPPYPRSCHNRGETQPPAMDDEVVLTLDELEALRLKDLEGLSQTEAAKRMNISQPTFNRLLSSARKKVSGALVGGKAIRIEGGNVALHGLAVRYCVCPVCGRRRIKPRGIPCASMRCERCGALMVRE